jgi:hypothetical protein
MWASVGKSKMGLKAHGACEIERERAFLVCVCVCVCV